MSDPYRPTLPPPPPTYRKPLGEEDLEYDSMIYRANRRAAFYTRAAPILSTIIVTLVALLLMAGAVGLVRSCERPCTATALPDGKSLCICPEGRTDHVTIEKEGAPCRR